MIIKTVSLWEPWASLTLGPKGLETRSWNTSYRGPLLICAAKGGLPKDELLRLVLSDHYFEALCEIFGFKFVSHDSYRFAAWGRQIIRRLHFGLAVTTCNLAATYKTETMTREQIEENLPFGDFSPKRFAWDLRDRKAIKKPFPVRGKQSLFDVEILENLLCP